MSAPNSVEELLQLIRKSGMVDESKLNGYLHRRQAGRGLPADPREAADAMVTDGLITNFQSEQFMLGKWRGFTVGKYKLLERVGVGGMGQVFLCEHMFMKRRVAIKVLPPSKADQPAALGRFYREARAAGSLEHPNVVRTHDIDQDGNLHFIVMEYVDGSNLLDIVKKFGPMEIRRATHYIRQIALGLDYAFQNGLIHRDIKPGNFLVDRAGNCKLLDMGLARYYQDQTDMLTIKYDDKIVLGTADYVAPEQVANSHEVDIRADIYALGASFYFLLAGHPPFPTGTVSQKLLWHRTKDPTPIRQLRPEVPEGIAAIIGRMMQKDPNGRYRSPAEVAIELERWVPASIPVPSVEEMPALSPAATEAVQAESSKLAGVPSVSMSQLRKEMAAAEAELASPPKSVGMAAVKQSYASTAVESRGGTTVAPPPAPVFGPRPIPAPQRQASPFPSPFPGAGEPIDTPTPSANATPYQMPMTPINRQTLPGGIAPPPAAPSGALISAHPNMPGSFPFIAVQPKEETGTNRTRIVIGLVTVAAVLAIGLFLYKFVLSKPTPKQETEAVEPAK